MTTITHIAESRRELAHRSSNGIDVYLHWSSADDAVAVTVHDGAGASFELVVRADEALEAFNHPYAYAAFRGLLETEDRAAQTEEVVFSS